MEKQHIQLIVKAFVLVLGWLLVYDYLIGPDGRVDDSLTEISTAASNSFLQLLSFNTTYKGGPGGQIIYIGNLWLLRVGHSCNGLILYAIFLGFIFIFPTSWKSKLGISLVGVAVIFSMNVVRIISLCLIYLYHPSFFEISHHFIFTAILYGIIFLLWMFWINKIIPKVKMA